MSSSASTTTNTTLIVPTGAPALASYAATVATINGTSGATTIVGAGFTLYIPYTNTVWTSVDVQLLANSLAAASPSGTAATSAQTGTQAYSALIGTLPSPSPIPLTTSAIVSVGSTLWIPYTQEPPTLIDCYSLVSVVQAAATQTVFKPSVAQTTPSTASSVSSSSTGSSSSVSPASSDFSASSTSSSTTPTKPATHTPTPTSTGLPVSAVAGGTVGGFFLGLLICSLIAFWCIRRGRSRPTFSAERDYGRRTPVPTGSSNDKEAHSSLGMVNVTGWQKHLPQEKDDATITKTFRSIFEQIQIHTEGFYEARLSKNVVKDEALLAKVSDQDIAQLLLRSRNSLPLLEGILVRWIVHRISLFSSVEDSLLPSEYTRIPHENGWHMEDDGEDLMGNIEARNGFVPAFSQWRRLTGFLRPDPKSDPAFQAELTRRIKWSAQELNDAFKPWQIPGKDDGNRVRNLRKIILQASEAGVLLFTQPTTFMFDWSSPYKGRDDVVVISPALVKRLDEYGHPPRSAAKLLPERTAKF